MSVEPVEWVLVIRYGLSAHRATYGRLAGNAYTKDYIQLYRKPAFLNDLEGAFPALSGATHSIDITYRWPVGHSSGKIVKKSADRPHLAWGTSDAAPAPWKMSKQPSASTVETIRGNPTHRTEIAADNEYDQLVSSGFGQPFLIAVKLKGNEAALHLRVLVQDPEDQFAWADLKKAPLEIQDLAMATSTTQALAWRLYPQDNSSVELYFDPDKKVDWWSGPSIQPAGGLKGTKPPIGSEATSSSSIVDSDLIAEGLDHAKEEVAEFEDQLNLGNYEVPDSFATAKTRGSAQKAFSVAVKNNYGWTCALTGIKTKCFLIASHIVPWSVDDKIRLDPSNGICFSVFADRAFEHGFLVIEDDLVVRIDWDKVGSDTELTKQLSAYDGAKLMAPKVHRPRIEHLQRRRTL